MATVFISYRRQDTEWVARSLCMRLREFFGSDCVFMDVDTIHPGDDFVKVIEDGVGRCKALIALIGPNWLDIRDEDQRCRLEDPNDFIRLEIATALKRGVRVIPVLMDGTRMPRADELPEDIAELVRRHGVDIRARNFLKDTEELIQVLSKAFQDDRRGPAEGEASRGPSVEPEVVPDLRTANSGSQVANDDAIATIPSGAAESDHRVDPTRPKQLTTKVVGIDLGTTNSVIAVCDGAQPTIIANVEGHRFTPSVVAMNEKQEVVVGELAKRQAITNPRNTVYSIKRFMGRRCNEVMGEWMKVPYELLGSSDDYVSIKVRDRGYMPQEISAFILRELRAAAEAHLDATVERAVITVPAYFNDAQRQATKNAAEIAGLKVARIINEPTAAAMAYGLGTRQGQKIAVFDLGGGTFDVSILEIARGVGDLDKILFEVISTNGDTHLGGDDFDNALVDLMADAFMREHGIDIRKDTQALARLRVAAEEAKKKLSADEMVEVNLPFITADASGPKHLRTKISRAEFEQLIGPLVKRCQPPIARALDDAGLKPQDIDVVVMVGGSTRIPKVRRLVTKLFGREPHTDLDPELVVAQGAAIQGGVLSGDTRDVMLLDVTPLSLGLETLGGVNTKLVKRNTTIPTEKKQVFSTTRDGQSKVRIHIVQGERPMASDNRTLGRFYLRDIPPAPRGVPKIEVRFDIDQDGILHVSAKDLETGKKQSMHVEASAGLSQEEIERMRSEGEGLQQRARASKELTPLRREVVEQCSQAERLLEAHPQPEPDVENRLLITAIANARKAAREDQPQVIRTAVEAVIEASQALIQAIYGPLQ